MTEAPGSSRGLGQRSLVGTAYGGRLGPFLQIPLDKWVSFSISGGLALARVDSTFQFNESVTLRGVGTLSNGGSTSDSEVVWGGYVGGTLSCAVTDRVNIFAGAQFQALGDFTQKIGNTKAELNLGESVFVTAGVGFSF